MRVRSIFRIGSSMEHSRNLGDLGYWVGYRIVKSYYQHAADKRRAIRDILEMSDPKAFLADPALGIGAST